MLETDKKPDNMPIKDDSLPIEEILNNRLNEFNKSNEESNKDDSSSVSNNDAKIKNVERKIPITEESVDSTLAKDEPKSGEPLTPLERLKLAQAEKNNRGIIIDNDELNKSIEESKGPKQDFSQNAQRTKDINNTINEWDKTIELRKHVVLVKDPADQLEYLDMITEFDHIGLDDNGNAYIRKDSNGNPYVLQYLRLRNEDEGYFDFDGNSNLKNIRDTANSEDKRTVDNESDTVIDEDEEKNKTIEIIIDKTGLGGDFKFTEEEQRKIDESDVIKLKKVKTIDINMIKERKSEKSFQDVIKEFDLAGQRTSVCFPGSGFKAQMRGMTYGEYTDIATSVESANFDEYYKRLTVIYNNMTNISTGPFKDFEDFLKKFAFTDIPMAIYGLVLSTESENSVAEIPLTCGNDEVCGLSYTARVNRRSLLKLNKCHNTYLEKMKEIVTADAMDYDKIAEEAIVNKPLYIQLPDSGFIAEIGIASAYDFLYNFIPVMNEDGFREEFGENASAMDIANVMLLTSLRSIRIPDGDEWVVCDTYKEILRALYKISTFDIKVITNYANKFQEEYRVVFTTGRVECPHCHTVTDDIDFPIDNLVFTEYQRLMSTEIDLPQ